MATLNNTYAFWQRLEWVFPPPKSWTPNGVSRFRMWWAAPIALLVLLVERWFGIYEWSVLTLLVYTLGAGSDAYDGYLASIGRHPSEEEAKRGPSLDEQADKVFVFMYSSMLYFVGKFDMMLWVILPLALIAVRDVHVTKGRIEGDIPKSVKTLDSAKYKTFSLMFGLGFITISNAYFFLIGAVLICASAMWACYSWYWYYRLGDEVNDYQSKYQ